MRRRALLSSLFAVLLAVGLAGPATAADPNPWLDMRVMNMAHSGGEDEAPMNTMYAFKRAVALGADMLELDVQSTKDGQLVVIHDATVDATTNGTGRVVDKTLDEIKALDAAYWFVPGRSAVHGLPDDAYPLRGARHGKPKVRGYKPSDFKVPTLREVLRTFPDTPINIEIKGTSDADTESFLRTGRLLSQMLNKSGRTDIIVASFNDAAIADFHARSPQIGLSPGMQGLIGYVLFGQRPIEGTVALQVPVTYAGIPVVTRDFVTRAHADGYAVHVWFSGSAPDDAATYNAMIDTCADGLMPSKPTLLESILDFRGIERPGTPGLDPCAAA
ncbi:glycerophosphodiester phosphodiesterase [Actinomycetota bacterium]